MTLLKCRAMDLDEKFWDVSYHWAGQSRDPHQPWRHAHQTPGMQKEAVRLAGLANEQAVTIARLEGQLCAHSHSREQLRGSALRQDALTCQQWQQILDLQAMVSARCSL